MLIAHYAHRLPAGFSLDDIRVRANDRVQLWSTVPELYFKAFLLRERGKLAATASTYASIYLWRSADAFRDLVTDGRFAFVIDAFGRPAIDTRVVVDARRGRGVAARFATVEDIDVPLDADLAETFVAERERNGRVAESPEVVAATVGLDAQRWRMKRIVLSGTAPEVGPAGQLYEVLQLATPLLDALPRA